MDFGGHYQLKSSPTDRFLNVFSPPNNTSSIFGDELNEDDVFWTGDFAVNSNTNRKKNSSDETTSFRNRMFATPPFQEERFGILAALSDGTLKSQPLRRKSFAAKNMVAIPKVKTVVEKEVAALPKFNYSASVNVPVMTKEMMKANARRNKAFYDVVDDESEDDERLPPHEIVARGSGVTPNATFSMLEGAGRTLKGRDLRRVRNAVFRQTGFLD